MPQRLLLSGAALAVGTATVFWLAACGSSVSAPTGSPVAPTGSTAALPSPTASSAPTRSAAPRPSPRPTPSPPPIDPDQPLTQAYSTTSYAPPFRISIPADWTAVERDAAAFQVYQGNEDYEITLDHTYTEKETVAEAIARLKGAAGLKPGDALTIDVGGRTATGFEANPASGVEFADSGFHTNTAGPLAVLVVPMPDGTTITIFLTSPADPGHGLPQLKALATRVLASVKWR